MGSRRRLAAAVRRFCRDMWRGTFAGSKLIEAATRATAGGSLRFPALVTFNFTLSPAHARGVTACGVALKRSECPGIPSQSGDQTFNRRSSRPCSLSSVLCPARGRSTRHCWLTHLNDIGSACRSPDSRLAPHPQEHALLQCLCCDRSFPMDWISLPTRSRHSVSAPAQRRPYQPFRCHWTTCKVCTTRNELQAMIWVAQYHFSTSPTLWI